MLGVHFSYIQINTVQSHTFSAFTQHTVTTCTARHHSHPLHIPSYCPLGEDGLKQDKVKKNNKKLFVLLSHTLGSKCRGILGCNQPIVWGIRTITSPSMPIESIGVPPSPTCQICQSLPLKYSSKEKLFQIFDLAMTLSII